MDEELVQILANSELDDSGKAEAIKNLVGKSFVPTTKYNAEKQNTKAQLDAYNELKTEFETFKQSKMTDEEKQTEALKLEREKSEKNSQLLSQLFAENVFAKAGFEETDYKELIPTIIQEDPEKTKSFAETICETMLKQKQSIENKMKESIIKGQKKPDGGNDDQDGLTELDKLKKGYEEAVKARNTVAMAMYTRLISEAQQKK